MAVLPNRQDEIPAQYAPIREAVVDAMTDRPLTPMYGGGHAPASRLLQAEAGLKAFLDRDDIQFLVDGDEEPRNWAVAATQRNSRVDRFLGDLKIKQWGVEEFLETLEERFSNGRRFCYTTFTWREGPDQPFLDWMRSKPGEWHRALYALFQREFEDELHRFHNVCIVRRSDGEYGTGSECFFPTPEIREDPIHPRVAEDTYEGGGSKAERRRARAFLEGIGVREVGELQQIEAILKRRYADPDHERSWKIHVGDLRRFIALVEKDRNANRLFEKYYIFQRADGLWSRPSGVFLDTPYLDTGLRAYYDPFGSESGRAPLSDKYRTFDMLSAFVLFVQRCGVASGLQFVVVRCDDNPDRTYLRDAPGCTFTSTGINRDFVIPGLETLFEKPTPALSRLIWNALCARASDKSILKATFQYNQSNYPHHADSQLVHQLRNNAWIPQGGNEFVRPAAARRDLLPDGFAFDPGWPWLKAVRFGDETQMRAEELRRTQEIATELGFRDDAALTDGRRFAELPPDTRRRILSKHEETVVLPLREPGNRERRAETVREKARKAPERISEKRPRTVSVSRDAVKREQTNPYLRNLYTNADSITICQICKDRLPFKLDDGSYFFEAVEFLPDLERHHYQNYLALCPNHAAMFMHANGSKDEMRDRLLDLDGSELDLTLAEQPVTVYFTESHVADLRVVVEVEDGK